MARTPQNVLWVSTAARGGISAFVATVQETDLWQHWCIRTVVTHDNGALLRRIAIFLRGFFEVLFRLAFSRPALIHLHVSHYGSFYRKALIAALSKASGVPVILHIHGSKFHTFATSSPAPAQLLIRLVLRNADAVLALGDAWAERLENFAPGARIMVVPNAVCPQTPNNQHSEGPVRFVFLGQVGERKGTFILIEAWAKMMSDPSFGSLAHLTIAGDGEVERADELVNSLGVDKSIDVKGWVSRSDAQELLDKAHVLVLPSQNEGQPMAILEAMAKGLCVIASNVGGIPEMLRGEAGILVPPDHIDVLSVAMASLTKDHERRKQLGSKAFRRVQSDFNVSQLAGTLDKLYKDTIL